MGKNQLPPGFRFHPTDVELVKYHLKRKVLGKKLSFKAIADVDIYKYAPWDLPDMSCLKTGDLKWFFYCPIEKKYARGAKLNRATVCGYWKTTGKDRSVKYNEEVVGMIKTLVFHKGKAPHGDRTDWVMHEYRLEEKELADRGVVQDTYVLCVVFKKDGMGPKNGAQYGAPFKEEDWSDDDEEEYANLLGTSTLSSMSPAFGVACSSCVPESLCAGPSTESRGLFTLPPVIHTNAAVSVTCNIDSYAYGAPTFVDLESLHSRQSVESSGLFTLPPMVHTNTTISVPPMVHTNAAVSVTSDIHSNAYGAPAVDLESLCFGSSVESSELYTLPLVVHTNATVSDSNACAAPTCGDAPQVLVVTDAEVVPAVIDAPQLAQVHQVEESNDNILSMLDMFIEEEVMNTDEGQITGFVKAPQITDDDDISSMLAYFTEDNYLNNVLYSSE